MEYGDDRSNLHQSNVSKALKELMAQGLIKEMKSAQSSRRIWLVADVEPNQETLGGVFVDDGKFDPGMIDSVSFAILNFIEAQSWAEAPPPHDPHIKEKSKEKSKSKIFSSSKHTPKPAAEDRPTLQEQPPQITRKHNRNDSLFKPPTSRRGNILIPHHPTYTKYPTTLDITFQINEDGIVHHTLSESDIQQVLNKLEFDGRIERMRDTNGKLGEGYRTVRRVWKQDRFNEKSQFWGPIEPNPVGEWADADALRTVSGF